MPALAGMCCASSSSCRRKCSTSNSRVVATLHDGDAGPDERREDANDDREVGPTEAKGDPALDGEADVVDSGHPGVKDDANAAEKVPFL